MQCRKFQIMCFFSSKDQMFFNHKSRCYLITRSGVISSKDQVLFNHKNKCYLSTRSCVI